MPPRPRGIPRGGSQARTAHPPPRVTVTLPAPQPRPVGLPRPPGSGQKGVGAGVTTPPYQRPRAAGAFDSFVPERWGPRLRWAAASRHSTPPGRPSRTMVTYSIVRSGLVVELSEPLPGGAVRMPTPRTPPHVRAGMTAEITALLNKGVIEPTADHPRLCLSPIFSSPSARGIFRLILNHKRINRCIGSVHFRMETLASIRPVPEPGRPVCLHRLKRCIASRTYSRTVKRLARLYIQRKGLSLHSAALRTQARTPHLHRAGRMRGRISPPAGSALLLLPRRLAAGSPLAPTAKAAPGLPFTDSTGPGAFYQLGQVGARPDSVPDVRGDFRYPPAAGAAKPGEDRHYRGGGPAAAQS